jgi:hypothetical protein
MDTPLNSNSVFVIILYLIKALYLFSNIQKNYIHFPKRILFHDCNYFIAKNTLQSG